MRKLFVTAVACGVLAIGGGGYFTYKIQHNFINAEYYRKSMEMLIRYPPAVEYLGSPVRSRWLDLSEKANYVDGLVAQIQVPITGSLDTGMLYITAHRDKPGIEWEIDKLDIEIRKKHKRWTFYMSEQERIKTKLKTEEDALSDNENA